MDDILGQKRDGIEKVDCHVEDKIKEKFQVALADTVRDPDAVMVHSVDASATPAAVM